MSESEFPSDKFKEVSARALSESSRYIRQAMMGEVDLSTFLMKEDKTAVNRAVCFTC